MLGGHLFLAQAFDVLVEEMEEAALPENAVLGLENPVVFIGIQQEFGRNAAQDGRVERCHALGSHDTVVEFPVDNQDRRIPFFYELMRGVGEGALRHFVRLVPVRAAHVPVGEPEFLGFGVLLFHVEHPVVGDESLEAFVVVAGQPIDRECPVAGTDAAQLVLVDVRFLADGIDGGQVVFHVLSGIVAADLFEPFHAESRHAAAVRCYDDVVVGCHDLRVPAVAPELADRALGAALAVKKGGILLAGVETGRVDDPGEHLLSIGGPDPSAFHAAHFQLVEDVLVDEADLGLLVQHLRVFLVQVYRVQFVGTGERLADANQLVSGQGINAYIIMDSGGQALDGIGRSGHELEVPGSFARSFGVGEAFGYVQAVNLAQTMPVAGEIDLFAVLAPFEASGVLVEAIGSIHFLGGLQVEQGNPVLVGFITLPFHAFPSQVEAVRTEHRVHIVTQVAFAGVDGLAAFQIVNVDIGVGGYGVSLAGQLAGSVGQQLAVRAPAVLLDTAERLYGRFVRLILQHIDRMGIRDGFQLGVQVGAFQLADEDMRNRHHVVVPMAVVQILEHHAAGFVQVGIAVLHIGFHLHLTDKGELFQVRAETEAFHASGNRCDLHRFERGGNVVDVALLGGGAEGLAQVEAEDLHSVVGGCHIGYGMFVEPAEIAFRTGGTGNLAHVLAVDVGKVEVGIALVFGYAVIADRISDMFLVRADGYFAQAAHGPEDFRGQTSVGHCHFLFSDNGALVACPLRAAGDARGGHGRGQGGFL